MSVDTSVDGVDGVEGVSSVCRECVESVEPGLKVGLEGACPLGPLLAVVRVADGVCLCVPAHVCHADCLGASVSVLPGPGGCGAGLRGSGGLVASSGGSTGSCQTWLEMYVDYDSPAVGGL